ncbi:MAG: L,D-transpeptidase [Thiotrichaceae bacterium]
MNGQLDAVIQAVIPNIVQSIQPFKENNSVDDFLLVSVLRQTLFHIIEGAIVDSYPVSTAIAGVGNTEGSGKTPLGVHRIAEKIGDNAEYGELFKARVSTNNIATILTTDGQFSDIDAITTRILWLDGLELGNNKGTSLVKGKHIKVDSYQRYIYIHGTDEEWRLGRSAYHGCIRMANHAISELYDKVYVNTLVVIIE